MVVLEPFGGRCIGVLTASIQNVERLKLKLPNWPFAMIDARYVTGECQLAAAACACLVAERDGRALTKSLPIELLYRISGSTNVAESLKTFGLNPASNRVVVVSFEMSTEQVWGAL
jgi:tRNA threonylcarbamoyladenosine modification (KEOPS) complex Cgi121 subunit